MGLYEIMYRLWFRKLHLPVCELVNALKPSFHYGIVHKFK